MSFRIKAITINLCAAAALISPVHLLASETINYQYDAQGRLIGSQRSGTINNGVNTAIVYDRADNRQSYVVTGASVILKESFEGAVPAFDHKPDGGYSAGYVATNAPFHGSQSLRIGLAGGHNWRLTGATFVAAQATVTISIYVRDSGVTNASLNGWSYSSADSAAPFGLGLYNVTTSSWALDGQTDPSPFLPPPNGGTWVRHTRTLTGLTVGQTYSAAIFGTGYTGIRASDIDALQIEYGTTATPYF